MIFAIVGFFVTWLFAAWIATMILAITTRLRTFVRGLFPSHRKALP